MYNMGELMHHDKRSVKWLNCTITKVDKEKKTGDVHCELKES